MDRKDYLVETVIVAVVFAALCYSYWIVFQMGVQ